ncbi:MAG: decarboxylase, partial [Planctomycetes bacterium]|nr:decarboxylase [Planctomycetota bacterium]
AGSGDRAAGKRPFCVIANAGTTNTGAVDPLPALADFCQEHDLWLHVDGAYGAAAVICDEGRTALRGIDRADSLVLDPHKWLFQPFECGCVLVRERGWLADTFRMTPDYLQDAHRKEPETNFCDWGLQLTRSARALKLWMSIKVFGLAAFRDAVQQGFEQARFAERCLRSANCWEIVTPAQMGIVSFRYAPIDATTDVVDAVNDRLVAAVFDDGYAMISSTQLHGRTVLRMCPINPRTSEDDIISSIDQIGRLARDLQGSDRK